MNYAPQTEVHLLSNVPFNYSYNNVRDFNTIEDQTEYFIGKSNKYFDKLTYQRVNNNVIKLEMPYEELFNINYMMFKNSAIEGKWFYAFITDYKYISPNVTAISYQIDVFQTWLFEMNWQSTYVEREHRKRYNELDLPYVNTLEEELAYGSEYRTIGYDKVQQVDNIVWCIIVAKAPLGSPDPSGTTISNIQQPLNFYAIPFDISTGESPTIGGEERVGVNELMQILASDSDYTGYIVSMYYTSYVPFFYTYNDGDINGPNLPLVGIGMSASGREFTVTQILNQEFQEQIKNVQDNVYDKFPHYSESKLLMYPYSIVELTDFKGQTFTLKMENIDRYNDGYPALSFGILSCISTQPKTAIYPRYYLGNMMFNFTDFSQGIIDNDICDIPVIDDYTASYMQANRNSIATTNKYALDNAKRGVSQNNATNRLANQTMDVKQDYAMLDAGINAVSSLASFNIGGALKSGYEAYKNWELNEWQRDAMNLNNEFANVNLNVQAEQQIGLSQAKIEDINNIPPTISNMGNNSLFNLGNKLTGFYVLYKTIKQEYVEKLTNYFKMFGYKVNELEIPNTKSRKSWNYIKTIDANIIGNIPSRDLATIKGIFDRGVTIWHVDDIGNYDLNNREV